MFILTVVNRYLYLFLKAKHAIVVSIVNVIRFGGLRVARLRVMAVKKLDDLKATSIDIKMYVSGLEIRSTGLPDRHFRMQLFNGEPGSVPDAFAVSFW